jgi:hypothetical protein
LLKLLDDSGGNGLEYIMEIICYGGWMGWIIVGLDTAHLWRKDIYFQLGLAKIMVVML